MKRQFGSPRRRLHTGSAPVLYVAARRETAYNAAWSGLVLGAFIVGFAWGIHSQADAQTEQYVRGETAGWWTGLRAGQADVADQCTALTGRKRALYGEGS